MNDNGVDLQLTTFFEEREQGGRGSRGGFDFSPLPPCPPAYTFYG
jgi:hypothetical protein